ncbi:MAG TPA: ornithine cyclodeaminase family protein [Pyrinomonadaceae bacterium]|nr:ornithine cyclodeaminase family protein [Pyrinomonadaceae bacterium]
MTLPGTLLLSRREVAELLSIDEYIEAVERVFRLYGEGKTQPPGILGVHAHDGGFHIKAGLLELARSFFAAKINANFPHNAKRFGLPLIQGVIVLADGQNGYPLAIMDSMEITIQRTGAATAVAAKYLARRDSKSIMICGCGNQGRVSIHALSKIFSLEHVYAYDVDEAQALRFANEIAAELKIPVEAAGDLQAAMKCSDICVTCTPSTRFFLKQDQVQPGTFVAAVGADSETKQEVEPVLLAQNTTVVDIVEQCAVIGELHHAIASELMTKQHVQAELGEVVAGIKPGRTSADEIIIFDSTGMALQDVIVAATVYQKAIDKGAGSIVNLAQ